MKRMTAAIAIALSAAAFEPAVAQVPNLQFQTPLNYRFSVQPKSHVFFRDRRHRHGWRHRHPRRQFLPLLAGPAVIYRNGETVPPEQTVTEPAVPVVAYPVVYRIGETGSCDVQRVGVAGSKGRTTVNVWYC